jgi:hypothetical protein
MLHQSIDRLRSMQLTGMTEAPLEEQVGQADIGRLSLTKDSPCNGAINSTTPVVPAARSSGMLACSRGKGASRAIKERRRFAAFLGSPKPIPTPIE